MTNSEKFVAAVFTIGDTGGYKIYEWFKLFFEERERAIREYIYLKAYLSEQSYADAGHPKTHEELNELYLALGKAFDSEDVNYGCNYDGLCESLQAYHQVGNAGVVALFCTRSGIGSSVYSKQLVQDVPELISRTRADLWKSFR